MSSPYHENVEPPLTHPSAATTPLLVNSADSLTEVDSAPIANTAQTRRNSPTYWTDEQTSFLLFLRARGVKYELIAVMLGAQFGIYRPATAVSSKLYLLRLTPDDGPRLLEQAQRYPWFAAWQAYNPVDVVNRAYQNNFARPAPDSPPRVAHPESPPAAMAPASQSHRSEPNPGVERSAWTSEQKAFVCFHSQRVGLRRTDLWLAFDNQFPGARNIETVASMASIMRREKKAAEAAAMIELAPTFKRAWANSSIYFGDTSPSPVGDNSIDTSSAQQQASIDDTPLRALPNGQPNTQNTRSRNSVGDSQRVDRPWENANHFDEYVQGFVGYGHGQGETQQAPHAPAQSIAPQLPWSRPVQNNQRGTWTYEQLAYILCHRLNGMNIEELHDTFYARFGISHSLQQIEDTVELIMEDNEIKPALIAEAAAAEWGKDALMLAKMERKWSRQSARKRIKEKGQAWRDHIKQVEKMGLQSSNDLLDAPYPPLMKLESAWAEDDDKTLGALAEHQPGNLYPLATTSGGELDDQQHQQSSNLQDHQHASSGTQFSNETQENYAAVEDLPRRSRGGTNYPPRSQSVLSENRSLGAESEGHVTGRSNALVTSPSGLYRFPSPSYDSRASTIDDGLKLRLDNLLNDIQHHVGIPESQHSHPDYQQSFNQQQLEGRSHAINQEDDDGDVEMVESINVGAVAGGDGENMGVGK
ncbi:MAG: hypothetical protein M1819_001822 [Sarea resinae]|nr:MAG: hypothetical protein M1819_001822 [Sarea resinae]